MTLLYSILSTISFWVLFSMWKTYTWYNQCIKLFLLTLAILGTLEILLQLGYLIKI